MPVTAIAEVSVLKLQVLKYSLFQIGHRQGNSVLGLAQKCLSIANTAHFENLAFPAKSSSFCLSLFCLVSSGNQTPQSIKDALSLAKLELFILHFYTFILLRKMKNIFVNVHSTSLFFPVISVCQRKDITSPTNLALLLSFDCDSCNFIRVYQYDSRAIWDFCTKICIKSETTFMLMHRGNILLCFM